MKESEHLPLQSARFDTIESVTDFVNCLNDVFKILYKKDTTPFNVQAVNYFAFHCKNRYSSFEIRKSNGGLRPINAPAPYLKLVQRCTNFILQRQFTPNRSSHGFLLGRSIISNAKKHVGKRFVLNVDIENFFGSIEFRRIKTVLGLEPFNLSGQRESIAFLIANLCCHDGVLPQGGPCSPILTNIVCQRLDRKLTQIAKASRSAYTRYADDITFSSNESVFTDEFVERIQSILREEGFIINSKKTRVLTGNQGQLVTGIKVNKKLNVDRGYVRRIRAILNNYTKHGYFFTQNRFLETWTDLNSKPPQFVDSLRGQIEFLGMVRGKEDRIYLNYRSRFVDLFVDAIDFSFVENERVLIQLNRDYLKMKRIRENRTDTDIDRFNEYCTTAFMLVEELLNYYFSKALPFEKLLQELATQTFFNKGRSKNIKNVGQIEMQYKVFLFEKYFYYKEGEYYESIINKIRLVRNEGLHRCSVIIKDEKKILEEYFDLQNRIEAYTAINKTKYIKTSREIHVEYEFKLIPFLKAKDYRLVKTAISDLATKIENGLANLMNDGKRD